jgi:hypothetical protein
MINEGVMWIKDGIRKTVIVRETNTAYHFPRYYPKLGVWLTINVKPGIYAINTGDEFVAFLLHNTVGDTKLLADTHFIPYSVFN